MNSRLWLHSFQILRVVPLLLCVNWLAAPVLTAKELTPPQSIQAQLKPKVYRAVLRDRDVAVHADLDGKHYEIYAVMLVHASVARSRKVLTDYRVYPAVVPYVEEAQFDALKQQLHLRGGIWRYRLDSTLKFTDPGERKIAFEIVKGHFLGLKGEINFETQGERGTLVHMHASLDGENWPPALIVERGAEIVFGFTARRMRSYIEDFQDGKVTSQEGNKPHDPAAPQSQNYF